MHSAVVDVRLRACTMRPRGQFDGSAL